mmetsp:Transcript_91949/g.239696  ORF Transcript_91949/g.239696 Transcript_91949/m.239696 type:complete len:243 (+) Transcript_91949:451-1179(+)
MAPAITSACPAGRNACATSSISMTPFFVLSSTSKAMRMRFFRLLLIPPRTAFMNSSKLSVPFPSLSMAFRSSSTSRKAMDSPKWPRPASSSSAVTFRFRSLSMLLKMRPSEWMPPEPPRVRTTWRNDSRRSSDMSIWQASARGGGGAGRPGAPPRPLEPMRALGCCEPLRDPEGVARAEPVIRGGAGAKRDCGSSADFSAEASGTPASWVPEPPRMALPTVRIAAPDRSLRPLRIGPAVALA